jgi:excisionase family DNA binding protein
MPLAFIGRKYSGDLLYIRAWTNTNITAYTHIDAELLGTDEGEIMDHQKLLLSPDETCEALTIKRSTLFKMLDAGEITSIKIGRLRRIPVDGLQKYVVRQVAAQTGVEEVRE